MSFEIAIVNRIIFIVLILFSCTGMYAQTHIVSPSTYNYFQGVQEFPDSLVRIFMTNRESYSWEWDFAHSGDIGRNLKSTIVDYFKDTSGERTTIPAERMYVLKMPGGPTVMGVDQFHCDIDISSVMAIVSDSGLIMKEVTIDENESWGEIQKFGLVRPDVVGILLDWNTHYFDAQGNRVQFPEEQDIYTKAMPFGTNYIGCIDNKLYKLGQAFEHLDVEFISDSILDIAMIGESKILVFTSKEVHICNDQLTILQSNLSLDSIITAKAFNDRIWIGAKDGLYELDTLLQLLQFYPDSDYEQIQWLGGWQDSLLIITQYNGINHAEIGLKKFAPDQVINLLGPDISITQMFIPENLPLVYSIYCPSSPGLYFDQIVMTVTNHSEEVISEFSVGCDFGGSSQCLSFQKIWKVDTVMLLPHESVNIFIDSFTMDCVIPNGREFCAWTFSPNDTHDPNPANDEFCDTISILNTNPPVENKLISTSYFDTYVSHQILPDSTIRFFFHSSYRYPETTFADLKPGQSLTQLQPQTVFVPGSNYWNWSSDGFISLPFADGSTLLMNTTYPCDVTAPGAIVKINKHGEIDWFHDVEEGIYRAEVMMFLDSNRIGISEEYEGGNMLVIDRDGNIISFGEADFPHNHTVETLSGYVVSKDNQLHILNEGFQVTNTYTLAGDVERIWPQQGSEFIIKAGERFYLLDSLLQLETIALGNDQYDVVWKSRNYYFATNSLTRQVYVFLSGSPSWFTRKMLPPGVTPIWGASADHNVFVLTKYLNEVSSGLLVYTGGESNFHFRLQDDIGISAIQIPDTVHVYKSPHPIIGWTYRYDSISVEVSNYGLDTVFHYKIHALDDLDCGWCFETKKIWEIDTPLAPGATVSIPLGAFSPRCVPATNLPLCIATIGPDERADGNVVNDKYCQSILNTIVSAKEITSSSEVQIYPNPAFDQLYFNLPQQSYNDLICTVFNATGNVTDQFKIIEQSHSIKEYAPGIYLLMLADQQGIVGYQRIVKVNQ